jgi:hypothetical protein
VSGGEEGASGLDRPAGLRVGSVTLKRLGATEGVTVSVFGVSPSGRRGPAGKGQLKPPKPKRKAKKKH